MAPGSSTQLPPPPSSAPRPSSSGASATTRSPSKSLAQSKSVTMEHREATAAGPSDAYPSPNTAQMTQSGYYDPEAHHDFTREEEIRMANTLQHGIQHNVNAHTGTAGGLNNGHQHAHLHTLVAAGALPQGMAPPPQTPHQPSIVEGLDQQAAMESGIDINYTGDNTRRKRSKVSRACDECRRKKIRCDATAEDGSIKTCSNCIRIQQTCSFSRVPMKRGPSKGYIKELSERVQQVETQMAMTGQAPASGYRTSMDAGSPSAVYADTSYSPSESMSAKRTLSMSEGRANPFAQPQFMNRDRMPSAGGWSVGSAGQGYRTQGGRASIAIAPDQQMPDIDITTNGQLDLSKPFWAQDGVIQEHRQKRARLSETRNDAEDISLDINQDSLAPYFEFVSPLLPILPESVEVTTEHLQACPASLRHAFLYASSGSFGSMQLSRDRFASYKGLEAYVWTEARQVPQCRSASENLVWLWTYVFMVLNADKDLARLRGTDNTIPQGRLIKMAVDLARFLVKELKDEGVPSNVTDDTDSPYALARRAWNCIGILARLHAFGTSTEDSISLDEFETIGSAQAHDVLRSDVATLLARTSNILSILNTALQDDLQKSSRTFSTRTRKLIQQHLDHVILCTPDNPTLASMVNNIRLFIDIVLSRHTSIQHPIDILIPTLSLAKNICEEVSELPTKSNLKILDIHLFPLTTITLLEFTDVIDTDLSNPAWQTLGKLRQALEVLADQAQARNQQRFGDSDSDGMPTLHWADGLLRMIDSKPRTSEANVSADPHVPATEAEPEEMANGNAGSGGKGVSAAQQTNLQQLADMASTQGGGGDRVYDAKSGRVQMVDFTLLTRWGYLNVVADRNGV